MMSDEQWSEWIEWGGGEAPVKDGVAFSVRLRGEDIHEEPYDPMGNKASTWRWDHRDTFGDIIAYRYKLSDEDEQLIEAMQEAVAIERPYDAYTTDELVHAVRNMREEIRRRCAV